MKTTARLSVLFAFLAFSPAHSFSPAAGQSMLQRIPFSASPITISRADSGFHGSSPTALNVGFVQDDDLSEGKREQDSELSAVSISTRLEDEQESDITIDFGFLGEFRTVMTTTLLITGNTIGAGALVLPEVAAKPGMAISTEVFCVAYLVNLISGLVIAEVAIKNNEAHGEEAPASFKVFADANLNSKAAATGISFISLFVNTCVLAFNIVRGGDISSSLLGGMADPFTLSILFAGAVAITAKTQSPERLSGVASFFVTALFASFAGLLLPGLAHAQSPVDVLATPGTSSSTMSAVAEAAPVILSTMIYQNIVPSVTKILEYDRTKTVVAVTIGSFLPLAMYLAWCFAVVGGGVDTHVGAASPFMTVFSVAAVMGSTLGCFMSVAEELSSYLPQEGVTKNAEKEGGYPLAAVAVTVAVPLLAAHVFSNGHDLEVAGSYGSPVLYGIGPVAMAWTQRNKLRGLQNLVPGGLGSLGILGAAFGGFMANEFYVATGFSGM